VQAEALYNFLFHHAASTQAFSGSKRLIRVLFAQHESVCEHVGGGWSSRIATCHTCSPKGQTRPTQSHETSPRTSSIDSTVVVNFQFLSFLSTSSSAMGLSVSKLLSGLFGKKEMREFPLSVMQGV
jgi:hypothetical protein